MTAANTSDSEAEKRECDDAGLCITLIHQMPHCFCELKTHSRKEQKDPGKLDFTDSKRVKNRVFEEMLSDQKETLEVKFPQTELETHVSEE